MLFYAFHAKQICYFDSSENRKVSHYIITQRNGQYQIGDQTFSDLPEIVDYYRRHFLDTTTLVEAVSIMIRLREVCPLFKTNHVHWTKNSSFWC